MTDKAPEKPEEIVYSVTESKVNNAWVNANTYLATAKNEALDFVLTGDLDSKRRAEQNHVRYESYKTCLSYLGLRGTI